MQLQSALFKQTFCPRISRLMWETKLSAHKNEIVRTVWHLGKKIVNDFGILWIFIWYRLPTSIPRINIITFNIIRWIRASAWYSIDVNRPFCVYRRNLHLLSPMVDLRARKFKNYVYECRIFFRHISIGKRPPERKIETDEYELS